MRDIRDMEAFATSQNVMEEIYAERRRQVDSEGRTPAHDDEHRAGDMAKAAACYAAGTTFEQRGTGRRADGPMGRRGSILWPWDKSWWKPKGRRRDLVRAAALIVAEIERLDRAALKADTGEQR